MPDTETFGHEPVDSNGTQRCVRCWTKGQEYDDEYGDSRRYPPSKVRWPCTSAIVLGLARRP
ncbi:hypothetical protein AB0454_22670 [Streptomyces sp. NPDC093509]|uniref:hypothetical protein n=1 Tax=Streptomyces sp. NPDC093509 TaxID=3154982 RepID=UPI00344B51FC